MLKKIVLTGGPCSGKSTTLTEIQRRGYNTTGEVARKVLEERANQVDSEREAYLRQLIIFQRQILQEDTIDKTKQGIIFFDRGLVDSVVYSCFHLGFEPKDYGPIGLKNRYDKVFLLERLPFENDGVRVEKDDKTAERLEDALRRAYEMFEYDPIRVPLMSVPERVEFIISRSRGTNGLH